MCGGWFHERCASDHHSTRLKGTWRCVTCTKCLSCKTTIPGKVRVQTDSQPIIEDCPTPQERGDSWYEDFAYCKDCHSLKVKGELVLWVWSVCDGCGFQATTVRCVGSVTLTRTTTLRWFSVVGATTGCTLPARACPIRTMKYSPICQKTLLSFFVASVPVTIQHLGRHGNKPWTSSFRRA